MESITITANLSRSAVTVKAIRAEEIPNFFQNILLKHKQAYGSKYTPNQIVAIINLSKTRILRMRGKVWDQLVDGDAIWLVTEQEWEEYCQNVLDQEQLYRHGKKIVSRHPNSLSHDKLLHFVSQNYEGGRPVDPMKKFSSPPPPSVRSPPIKKPPTSVPKPSQEANRPRPKKTVADAKMLQAVRASLSPKLFGVPPPKTTNEYNPSSNFPPNIPQHYNAYPNYQKHSTPPPRKEYSPIMRTTSDYAYLQNKTNPISSLPFSSPPQNNLNTDLAQEENPETDYGEDDRYDPDAFGENKEVEAPYDEDEMENEEDPINQQEHPIEIEEYNPHFNEAKTLPWGVYSNNYALPDPEVQANEEDFAEQQEEETLDEDGLNGSSDFERESAPDQAEEKEQNDEESEDVDDQVEEDEQENVNTDGNEENVEEYQAEDKPNVHEVEEEEEIDEASVEQTNDFEMPHSITKKDTSTIASSAVVYNLDEYLEEIENDFLSTNNGSSNSSFVAFNNPRIVNGVPIPQEIVFRHPMKTDAPEISEEDGAKDSSVNALPQESDLPDEEPPNDSSFFQEEIPTSPPESDVDEPLSPPQSNMKGEPSRIPRDPSSSDEEDDKERDISMFDNFEEDVFDRSDRDEVEKKLLSEFETEFSQTFSPPKENSKVDEKKEEKDDENVSASSFGISEDNEEESELPQGIHEDLFDRSSRDTPPISELGENPEESREKLESPSNVIEEANQDASIEITAEMESEVLKVLEAIKAEVENDRGIFSKKNSAEEVENKDDDQSLSFSMTPDTRVARHHIQAEEFIHKDHPINLSNTENLRTDQENISEPHNKSSDGIADVEIEVTENVEEIEKEEKPLEVQVQTDSEGNTENPPVSSEEKKVTILEPIQDERNNSPLPDSLPSSKPSSPNRELARPVSFREPPTDEYRQPVEEINDSNYSNGSQNSIYEKFELQANELAELRVEKAALEARLDETRYLLHLFAGLSKNNKTNLPPSVPYTPGTEKTDFNFSPFSSFHPNLVDELEDTIKDISVETIDKDKEKENLAASKFRQRYHKDSMDSHDSSLTSTPEEMLKVVHAKRTTKSFPKGIPAEYTTMNVRDHPIPETRSMESEMQSDPNLLPNPEENDNNNIETIAEEISPIDPIVDDVEEEHLIDNVPVDPEEPVNSLPDEQLLQQEKQELPLPPSNDELPSPVSGHPTIPTQDTLQVAASHSNSNPDLQATEAMESSSTLNDPTSTKSASLLKKIETLKLRRKSLAQPSLTSNPSQESIPKSPTGKTMGLIPPSKKDDHSDILVSPAASISDEHGVFTKPRTPKQIVSVEKTKLDPNAPLLQPTPYQPSSSHGIAEEEEEAPVPTEDQEELVQVNDSVAIPSLQIQSNDNESIPRAVTPSIDTKKAFSEITEPSDLFHSRLAESSVPTHNNTTTIQSNFGESAVTSQSQSGTSQRDRDISSTTRLQPTESSRRATQPIQKTKAPASSTPSKALNDEDGGEEKPKKPASSNEQLSSKEKKVSTPSHHIPADPTTAISKQASNNAYEYYAAMVEPAMTEAELLIRNSKNETIDYIDVSRQEVISPLSMNSDLLIVEKSMTGNLPDSPAHIPHQHPHHHQSHSLPASQNNNNQPQGNSYLNKYIEKTKHQQTHSIHNNNNYNNSGPPSASKEPAQSQSGRNSRSNSLRKKGNEKDNSSKSDDIPVNSNPIHSNAGSRAPSVHENTPQQQQPQPPQQRSRVPTLEEIANSPADAPLFEPEPQDNSAIVNELAHQHLLQQETRHDHSFNESVEPEIPHDEEKAPNNFEHHQRPSEIKEEKVATTIPESSFDHRQKLSLQELNQSMASPEKSTDLVEETKEKEPAESFVEYSPLTDSPTNKFDSTSNAAMNSNAWKGSSFDEDVPPSSTSNEEQAEEFHQQHDDDQAMKNEELQGIDDDLAAHHEKNHEKNGDADDDLDQEDDLHNHSADDPHLVGNRQLQNTLADVNLQGLEPLVNYFLPFLITAKYSEDSMIRGLKARKQLLSSIQYTDIILWIAFQLYGSADGILVKQIKTTQISKLLQDAKVIKVASTQLDLQLVKVHAKLSASKAVSHGTKAPVMTKTGTLAVLPSAKKGSIGANPKTDPSAINNASFLAYLELLKTLTVNAADSRARSSSSSAGPQSPSYVLERLSAYFKDLIAKRDLAPYERFLLESKVTISGLLNRTVYARYAQSVERIRSIEQLARKVKVPLYSEPEIELVRQVWERNMDQIRLIYNFYAAAVESRRIGSGTLKLLLSAENCKEMLQDFQVLPQLIDVQNFYRLFRSVKLWEWEMADFVIRSMNLARRMNSHDENESKSIVSSYSTINPPSTAMSSKQQEVDPNDPYDFKGSVGHFSLSLWGFLELLTRIACFQNKLGPSPNKALENAMHLMDASNGKSKLLTASRKSISVRHFTYAPKK